MDFSTLRAEDVLSDDAVSEYKAAMNYFHMQLSRLNTDLFIVEKILEFPFDLFVGPGRNIFFVQVAHNFFEVATLQITKLATDAGPDSLTLNKFRNVVRTSLRPEYQAAFQEQLKATRFGPRSRELLEKAKRLRDHRIAHYLQMVGTTFEEGDRLTFQDLQSLRDEFNRLFGILSFDVEYSHLPIPYDPRVRHPAGSDWRPDIEVLLDSVAKGSSVIELPERWPDEWPMTKGEWPERWVEQFNHYRKRLGMPEV